MSTSPADSRFDEMPLEPERYELFESPRYSFEVGRRNFLKIAGGGILVCLFWTEASAQQPGRRGGGGRGFGGNVPQELGAWLHVDENGQVTVYTGKVEIGQNVRTSLGQVVADELRLAIESVRLVMADTDRTPFDAGTFGSASTPRMAPQLRRAAAAARELLIDLAAERAKVDRATLTVADGRVTHAPGGESFTFGELTHGQKLTRSIPADVSMTPVTEWKIAGTSVPKVDGRAMVTGAHIYASDIKRPEMLYAKVLRPPTLRAKLKNVDLKAAEALPGVIVIRDGDFVGVAAPSELRAEQALAAIHAEWDSPPQASDKTLFADLKKEGGGGGGFGGFGGGRGNQEQGSVEKGLAQAQHRLKATYTVSYIAHCPLEPRVAVAEWLDGKLTVWTGTQRPFGVRSDLARAFGLQDDQVRVIVPDTGSGYGGKHQVEAAIEAARLAKAAGKPVRLCWTREEEFSWAYFRPAGIIEVEAGVTNDGKLTAWDFHNFNSGASAIRPLYDVPNQRSTFHGSDAPLRQGSYRGLAATANHFARECHIDDLARQLALDPLKFRLKNLTDPRLRAVLEAAAEKFGWRGARPGPGRGIGIAGGSEKGSYVATCADVPVDKPTGKLRILRLVTAFECGAVVNPDHLKNQVEGAVVMGLGGALFEAIRFEDGKILNAAFSDYRVPRFNDMPHIETVLVDRKDLPSAGAGETPIVAVAPAISNAILNACGVRLRSLPMTPNGIVAVG